MKAVVDTNLLVSGLLWGNLPGRLIQAVADGRVRLYLSESLLTELGEVLNRDKFAARLALKQFTPATALAKVRTVARIVPVVPIRAPAGLRDPDDLHVLACAVTAGADAIVTGDKDLLALAEFEGIPILNVRTALEKLGIPAG